ncbi:MAG: hypothetical protein QM795_18185 [Pseudoxanthomonas sp.]
MLSPFLLAQVSRPLKTIDRRLPWVEKLIQAPLSEEDVPLVRAACRQSGGKRMGAFYHWYLQKMLVANAVRGSDRHRLLTLMERADHTDYTAAESLLDSARGVLAVVPHHAHYILSIVMMAERYREKRQVLLFYGRPEENPGNEVFDRLSQWFWGPCSNVGFVHDTPKGLAKAIKALRSGALVFIMPDALRSEEHALAIPFCGRPLSVMLGTPVLARKTDAAVLPMISTPHGCGLAFKTQFDNVVPVSNDAFLVADDMQRRVADYGVMRRIFAFYEKFISTQMLYWQNARRHLSIDGEYRGLSRAQVGLMSELIPHDPDLQPPALVVDIRG